MGLTAWLRAAQVVLFEASVVPAIVGTAAAVAGGSPFVPLFFLLILVSLVSIQAGANLFKGYYEAQGSLTHHASAGSWLAFDSGAAVGLVGKPRTVWRAGWAFTTLGIVAGLVLVDLTQSLWLLLLGLAGFFLAWSYSSPPLRLSYRGIGELSTFLAFGPIMTAGATLAYGTRGIIPSLAASLVLGFLAAAISFARYFPNEDEDRAKGKRTPVIVLGSPLAVSLLMGLWWTPLAILLTWPAVNLTFLVAWIAFPFLFGCMALLPRAVRGTSRFESVIGMTILAHLAAGAGLVLAFLL